MQSGLVGYRKVSCRIGKGVFTFDHHGIWMDSIMSIVTPSGAYSKFKIFNTWESRSEMEMKEGRNLYRLYREQLLVVVIEFQSDVLHRMFGKF